MFRQLISGCLPGSWGQEGQGGTGEGCRQPSITQCSNGPSRGPGSGVQEVQEVQGVQDAAPRQLQEGAPAPSRSIGSGPAICPPGVPGQAPWASVSSSVNEAPAGVALAWLVEGSITSKGNVFQIRRGPRGCVRGAEGPHGRSQPHAEPPAPVTKRHPLSLCGARASGRVVPSAQRRQSERGGPGAGKATPPWGRQTGGHEAPLRRREGRPVGV